MQGKRAAANAMARLGGKTAEEYQPSKAASHLIYESFALHAVGEPGDEESEEVMLDEASENACRLLVVKEGVLVGVQMLGTGKEFRDYEQKLGEAVA